MPAPSAIPSTHSPAGGKAPGAICPHEALALPSHVPPEHSPVAATLMFSSAARSLTHWPGSGAFTYWPLQKRAPVGWLHCAWQTDARFDWQLT